MGPQAYRYTLFCLLFLTSSMTLLGQIEGESKVISVQLKRPDAQQSESDKRASQEMKDNIPPVIQIISPQIDSSKTFRTSSASSYIIGRLKDRSEIGNLKINDSIVPVDDYGFFQHMYPLEDGLNLFKIEAFDEANNTITEFLTLIREPDQKDSATPDETDYPGIYYGLIIAIDNYDDPALTDLDHPITDATFLYSTLLNNYTFEPENITLLRDATRAEIIRALDRLSNKLSPRDNLLFFYAGHGYWDAHKETGYWLPADAEQSSSVNWIRNSTIQDYLDDINTRHTLLITDACFAGSIFKTRGSFSDASVAVNKLYSLTSRKAMTSGTLEEVPDKSVFIEYFLKRLLDNRKKYISSGELFISFREAVLNNSPNIPQYGVIQDTGDEGGEFIFIRK